MFKDYKLSCLAKDIPAGIIVALVSIPISMGYAQVSGLPVVYGLYGSLIPILIFGFMTSSPQFIFGVDAAPSALVGGMLASMGIVSESSKAVGMVPVITMVTAFWLILFFILRAGRFTNYISTPVMGGFISGIGCTIILMQIPKLFGGDAGDGELPTLLFNIGVQIYYHFSWLPFILGLATIIIIRVSAKLIPKVPMSVVMMFVGALITAVFHIEKYGVKTLPKVESGFPDFAFPDLSMISGNGKEIILSSLTIALVIVAETLLSTNNYALKNNYKINSSREILAYAVCNLASAISGCGPVSGSVSRTSIAAQFGARSQVMSIFASLSMVFVLMFGTGFISYLPVPVLTGIVIAALMGILEFDLAKKLKKADRTEWLIFYAAFWGVLLFGTIYGVIIGVILSFIAVVIRAVIPPKAYMGCIPGRDGFYALKRNRNARPIQNTVIYRFSGTLFFANIGKFQTDIENALTPDIERIIVDASGIGRIDITAAERLMMIYQNLKSKGIGFYITEHVGAINDQLRMFGDEKLIEEGVVKRTIGAALQEAGLEKPYPLVMYDEDEDNDRKVKVIDDRLAEFEWAFGHDADEKLQEFAFSLAEDIADSKTYDAAKIRESEEVVAMGHWDMMDEEDLLDYLSMQLSIISEDRNEDLDAVKKQIAERKALLAQELKQKNPEAAAMLKQRHDRNVERFRKNYPEVYGHIMQRRENRSDKMEFIKSLSDVLKKPDRK